ncbi:hypothetical protein PSHT_13824 [Puccinia striiformis]|uniref:CxC1-like cysteine cluster associated with KDZ transposases domain-containing protein n=1 Tax=Puccinia striiformis TaxID=27350 RepID=A0A2S4UNG6_9BASI|nr:hypothetical protein PSHT_13824 [Puccinia striiformis]
MRSKTDLNAFHHGSRLPSTETRTQKAFRKAFEKRTKAEIETQVPSHSNAETEGQPLGFSESSEWEDTGEIMNESDAATQAQMRSRHQELIQQQKYQNWKDVLGPLFPTYLSLKKTTKNWTLPCAMDNFSTLVCKCSADKFVVREVDLVDIMGQKRVKYAFCPCAPDPVHLLTSGYLASTPSLPQTAFSLRLLNFYDLMWNICNSHKTPFTKVLRRWNESRSARLCTKNSSKPRDLRRNFSASIDVYRILRSMQRKLVQTVTSITNQDVLAQRSCPACFGVSLPMTTLVNVSQQGPNPDSNPPQSGPTSDSNQPQLAPNPDLNTPEAAPNPDLNLLQPRSNPDLNPDRGLTQPPTRSQPAILPPSLVQDTLQQSNLNEAVTHPAQSTQPGVNLNQLPPDNNKIHLCLDGNFQHRHHERSTKNYIQVEGQPLFIRPEEIAESNEEILEGERAQRVSKKAKDRCTEQHKAADDRQNASSWKGCDDTGLFGCCCRHDSVIYFCNIHKTGEGRALPMSILKRIFGEINPNVQLGVLYDIGCTLKKFFQSRALLTEFAPRMDFATAVFHSYVHDWPCQLQYNPRYNQGWGLTDGEGLERLWSYLSPLVSPLRYATRNHRVGAINHRSLFHNELGIENIVVTLKRKTIHAMATKIHSQKIISKLYLDQNLHQAGQFFTETFFRAQWQRQRDFEINRSQVDRDKKEEQARFFERGEDLKSLAELFVANMSTPSSHSDPRHALKILQEIRELQKQHDEESKKLGSYFVTFAGTTRNTEQERRLGLLWSAKTALYKCAVQIQGETQPLRDLKTVTKVLQTFCDRRTDYLTNHAPDQLGRPENQPIDYDEFKKLQLDDERFGTTVIYRANEELAQLTNELRRTLSWGIYFRDQLKRRIDQCVSDTIDVDLKAVLEESFGEVSHEARKLVSDELESVQQEHEKLLLAWHADVEDIVILGFLHRDTVPVQWTALVEFLKQFGCSNSTEVSIDLALEETVLDTQDSDGESDTDDPEAVQNQAEHALPDDDE